MHLNSSRVGVAVWEMEVKAGAVVEMVPDQGPTTTGGSPKKVLAQLAGTATVTGRARGVGASRAEPTPTPAATLGWGAEVQIRQTRALQTQVPTGAIQSINPILKAAVTAGGRRLKTTKEPRTGLSQIPNRLTSGEAVLKRALPEALQVQRRPQVDVHLQYSAVYSERDSRNYLFYN